MSKKLIAGAGVVASFAIALAPLATFATEADWNSDIHTDTFRVTVLPTCSFGTTKNSATVAEQIAGVTHNADGSGNSYDTETLATWTTTTGTVAADTYGHSAISTVADDKTGMTPDRKAEDAVADNPETTDVDESRPAVVATEYPSLHVGTYSIYAGTTDDDFAETNLTVICNQANGYKVYANGADLTQNLGTSGAVSQTIAFGDTYSTSASGYGLAEVERTAGTAANITIPTVASGKQALTLTAGTPGAIVTNTAESLETGDTFKITYGIGVKSGQKTGTYEGSVVYTLVQQFGA